MDFYGVLEKRRTCRDFSDREVSDEILVSSINSIYPLVSDSRTL